MPTQAASDAFIAIQKTAVGGMAWRSRGLRAAQIAVVALEIEGLRSAALVCRQMPGSARHWAFTLRDTSHEHLRWDYLPPERPRRHRNTRPRPDDYPAKDLAAVHEHTNALGRYPQLSRPLEDRDTHDHEEAFMWFCERATIDTNAFTYLEPPTPQLSFPLES